MQCTPCIEAITPRAPNLGMSDGLRCWACSTRHRTSCLVGIGLERLLEDVQRLAVGAVADRVHAQLKAVLHRQLRGRANVVHRRRVQSGAVWLVGIGLEQPGAARSEGAVNRSLDGAHGEMTVAVVDHPVLRQLLRFLLESGAHHDPQPDAELVFVDHRFHAIDGLEGRSGVMKRRDALRQRLLGRQLEHATLTRHAFVVGRCRLPGAALDQARGGLAEKARRVALRVFQDLAALRALGRT